jgi:hypothetical protein
LIEQKIQEGIWFEQEFKINRDICEDCYKPESLSCRRSFIYHVYMELYAKDFERKFWNSCKLKRDEILSMHSCREKHCKHYFKRES